MLRPSVEMTVADEGVRHAHDVSRVKNNNDRFRGCLVGLACGDALGTSVEFSPRGSFPPVKDMAGGGPFLLKPGEWTDGTSMALCLAQSLAECRGFDLKDQIQRYCEWMESGYMSSNGRCFDIGATTRNALLRFKKTGDPVSDSSDQFSAGNGSIMRLAPVPIFYYPKQDEIVYYSGESSRSTHGAVECIDACRLFGYLLYKALAGKEKNDVLFNSDYLFTKGPITSSIMLIAQGSYRGKEENEILSSGYVVHCLEAALWCFYCTSSFKDAVLKAVNLGHDADTTGAVCGQIAGAFYGMSSIPSGWLKKLKLRTLITDLADSLRAGKQ